MAIGKLLAKGLAKDGDGVRRGVGKAVTKDGKDNANRWTPSAKSDVVKSQKADIEKIKTGMSAGVTQGDNTRTRVAQQAAAARAISRTGARAAAVGAVAAGAYGTTKSEQDKRRLEAETKGKSLADLRPAAKAEAKKEEPKKAEAKKLEAKKKERVIASKKASMPESGVREGKNENIDDDVRKRALDSVKNLNKGGMVKKGKC